MVLRPMLGMHLTLVGVPQGSLRRTPTLGQSTLLVWTIYGDTILGLVETATSAARLGSSDPSKFKALSWSSSKPNAVSMVAQPGTDAPSKAWVQLTSDSPAGL